MDFFRFPFLNPNATEVDFEPVITEMHKIKECEPNLSEEELCEIALVGCVFVRLLDENDGFDSIEEVTDAFTEAGFNVQSDMLEFEEKETGETKEVDACILVGQFFVFGIVTDGFGFETVIFKDDEYLMSVNTAKQPASPTWKVNDEEVI